VIGEPAIGGGSIAARRWLIERYRDDHAVYERTASLRVGTGFIGLRADGRNFHELTRDLEKPFDERFECALESAAEALMHELTDAFVCYAHSDELSLFLRPETSWFGRRVEKLVSVSAAIVSVHFSAGLGRAAVFDARALECPTEEDALAVLAERQLEAHGNAVTSVAHWLLVERRGMPWTSAAKELARRSIRGRLALLDELGARFDELPRERRFGRMLTWTTVPHTGLDPITGSSVETTRRVLFWERDVPDFRTLPSLPGYPPARRSAPAPVEGRCRTHP
jgi:tRNA(His) 5'-end guanylyltransferase